MAEKVDLKKTLDSYRAKKGEFQLLEVPPLELFESVILTVRAKGAPEALDDVGLELLSEGLCVQTLHLGSYDDEAPVLEKMHSEFKLGGDSHGQGSDVRLGIGGRLHR